MAGRRLSAEHVRSLAAMLLGLVVVLAFAVLAPAGQAAAAVAVTERALTLQPRSGPPGTTVSVGGSGFAVSDPVAGIVGCQQPATLTSAGRQLASGVHVDSDGNFATSITIPADAPVGSLTINASCDVEYTKLGAPAIVPAAITTLSATETFMVEQPEQPKQPESAPSIVLDPTSGPPGTVVGVSGAGFVCVGQAGGVYVDGVLYGDPNLSADGSFATRVQIPDDARPGDHSIRVVCADPADKADSKTFTVEATGGSGGGTGNTPGGSNPGGGGTNPGGTNPGGTNPGGGIPGGGGGGPGNNGGGGGGGSSQPTGWVVGPAVGAAVLVALGTAFLMLRLRKPRWVRAHVRATLRPGAPGQVHLVEEPGSEPRPGRLWLEARPDAGFQTIEEAQQ